MILLTYLYTLGKQSHFDSNFFFTDNFLFVELNKGSKEGDAGKIDTLGPYARAFGRIIYRAARNRTDIDADLKNKIEKEGILLYRGTGLKPEQLKEYQDKVGKTGDDDKVPIAGFISTSQNKLAAEGFTWSNQTTGHEATLFQIMWKSEYGYYVMDMSAFPEEQEILLVDGNKFFVVSVEKTVDQHGSPLNLVILKNLWYDW